MKIKFSNFVKLFLAGASLLAVGCTDYGQDIQNLRDDMNDRFDALQTETIDPLRADLTQVQKDLAAAQEAIAAQQLKHDEDVKALQDADEALQKAIDAAAKKAADDLATLASELRGADAKLAEDLKNLSDELKNSIAETNEKVAANEQAIADAVKKAADELAAVKAELEGKLDAESKKLTDLINAEVEKLNNALAQTNAKHAEDIQALQNALAATEALLKQEIADAKEELTLAIAAGDAAVKSELEAKIVALENALNNKIAALESDFNSKIAAANAAISKANEDIAKNAAAIVALEKALADAKAELEKAIADGDAKLAAELAQAVADLTALIEGYVKNLQDQVNAINTEIAGLKAVDADLQNQINALVAALAATNEKVATNAENIAANAEAIAKNANNINANADAIKALDAAVSKSINDLKAALDSHVAEFVAYKAEVAGLFAAVNAEIAILHAKDAEIEGLIAKLDERLKANEELAAQNAKDIAANKAEFDEYVAATAETLRLMQEAHDALVTRVGNLENDLTAHKEAIRKELDEHYAAFAKYQDDVAAEFAAVNETLATHTAAIKANADAIEANKAAIKANADAIADNAAAIAALDVRLTTLEDAHAALEKKHNELQDDFDAYVAKTDGVIASIQAEQLEQNNTLKLHAQQIADLDQAVKDLDAKVDAIKADLEKKIADLKTELQNQINDLIGDLETLKGRIQSLVFVPEHVDGAATVHYAMLGNTLVEGRSTLLYQVYPANCAAAVKAEDLKFVFTDELATSRANAPEFTVVDAQPVPNKEGVVAVTFDARNLSDEFYAGNVKYAVSLVLTTDLVNIASSYVNLAPATADQLDVKLINDTADRIRIEYTDTESKHVVLPEHTYEFSVNGKGAYDIDTIREMGYEVTVVKADPTYEFLHFDTSAPNIFLYEVDKTNPDLNFVTVSLKEVNKAAVAGLGTVKYSYDVCGKTLTAEGQVQVVKIQTKMTLAPQTITWTRSLDNEADGKTPKDPTNRVVTTTAGDLIHTTTNNVVTTTSYADIIAVAPTAVTINGQDVAVPYNVVFGGTSDAPTVDFTGFDWGTEAKPNEYNIVATFDLSEMSVTMDVVLNTVQKTAEVALAEQTITWNYAADKASELGDPTFRAVATTADNADLYADVIANGVLVSINPATGFVFTATGLEATGFAWNESYSVTAVYALEDKLVTVNAVVNTVKAAFTDLVINLDAAQWLLTKDFVNESKTPTESLVAYKFADDKGLIQTLGNLGDITAADYLKDIFVTYPLNAETYTVNGVDVAKDHKTNLVIDPAKGASIHSVYNIDDFSTAIPDKVVYKLAVTTWYGQKITFNKTLNIGLTPVKINLADETKGLVVDLKFTTDPESLAPIYDNLLAQTVVTVDNSSITTADDYLKAIFVTNALRAHEDKPYANTRLVVDPVAGNTAVATYDYNDFAVTPTSVVYKSTYTTWYGQEIEINKVVNVDWTTYNYKHVPAWVYVDGSTYYSNAIPEYTNNPTYSTLLESIIVSLDMNTAFKVVEGEKTIQTFELLAKGLVSTFDFTNAPVDDRIKFMPGSNNLYYHGHDKSVGVKAQLKLVNSNGVETILPTNFDDGQIYSGYHVNQYNPINALKKDDLEIKVAPIGKQYTYFMFNQLKLTDVRGYNLIKYGQLSVSDDNYVTYTNADWVVGDGTDPVGFANGKSVVDIYGLKMLEWSCIGIPEDLKDKLIFTPATGELYFDNTNNIELTTPIKLTIKAKITHFWADDEVTFTVTLRRE